MTSTVAIVDDQLLLATALARSLQEEEDLDVVAVLTNVDAAMAAPQADAIDLMLVSSEFVRHPEFPALTAATRTLVLLKSDVENSLSTALESNAAGGVPWTVTYPALVANVRAALRGEVCVPRELLGGLLGYLIERNRDRRNEDARFESLSKRERETLSLLTQGLEVPAIAEKLVVSPQTVRSHVRAIMTKLEVNSRLEVISLFRQMEANGSITPGSWT